MWRSVRRIIAGYIATALSGPRIIIDGTGTDPTATSTISMPSGAATETTPAKISLIPDVAPLYKLYISAPMTATSTISYIELRSDGMDIGGPRTNISGTYIGLGAPVEIYAGSLTMTGSDITLTAGTRIKRGALAAASLTNGWTNYGSGFQTAGY